MYLAAAECVTSKYPPILSSRTGLFFITKIGAHLVPTIEFGVSKSAGNFRLNVYNYVYIYIYILIDDFTCNISLLQVTMAVVISVCDQQQPI